MLLKGCNEEDFTNYKKASMFLIFPFCDFKCDMENGNQICQNWPLSKQPAKEIPIKTLVDHYVDNPIMHAIVCGGLEPMNSYEDLKDMIAAFREKTDDDIVIYTGYDECEIKEHVEELAGFGNIIMKFGRFRPGHKPHYDEVLGIMLASDNQYGKIL